MIVMGGLLAGDLSRVVLLQLIKILGNVQEKYRERPLCFPYSVKARVLLHAHFQRSVLNECTLGSGPYDTCLCGVCVL